LSMSARLIGSTDALLELADVSADDPAADEPFRAALRHIRSRLAATANTMFDTEFLSSSDLFLVDGRSPYGCADDLLGDLDI
ncbi:hypothetical protein G3I15_34450, partial [Streptomyces sp. SID10244]|nr:hypothetical protein [Streptomyces sp. SID10244]